MYLLVDCTNQKLTLNCYYILYNKLESGLRVLEYIFQPESGLKIRFQKNITKYVIK